MTTAKPRRQQPKRNRLAKMMTYKFLPASLIPVALLGILVYWYWQTWYYQPYAAFLQFAAVLFGLALVLGILAASWTARRLANPLVKLSTSMQKFLDGDWEARAAVRRQDELGKLAELFNQIADEYNATHQSLALRDSGDRNDPERALQWLAELAGRSPNRGNLLGEALEQITRSYACAYSVIYLLEYDATLEKRFVVMQQDFSIPGFDPSILMSVPRSSRINLDAIATLDWLVSRVIASGEPEVAEARLETGLIEAAIPLLYRGRVAGVLNLFAYSRSGDPRLGPFGSRALLELQKTAGLLTLAMIDLEVLPGVAGKHAGFQSLNLAGLGEGAAEREQALHLYQAGNWITQAETEEEAVSAASRALVQISRPTAVLLSDPYDASAPLRLVVQTGLPDWAPKGEQTLPLSAAEATPYFNRFTPLLAANLASAELPPPLLDLPLQMECDAAAYLPVFRGGLLSALLVLGRPAATEKSANPLPVSLLGPYFNLIELLVSSLEKIQAQTYTHRQLSELRVFSNISQAISLESDLTPLFETIHHQLESVMGELSSFAIALHEPGASASQQAMIYIPYIYEEGRKLEVAPFPLGEGLTSILIQTRKSLLLSENVEERSRELGAKVQGEPPKSWLGVPMIYGGDVIGAIIVQDVLREHRFTVEDERLLNTLAAQIAVVIRNARLLETTSRQAQQEHTLNEITARIRRAPDISSILATTVTELGLALSVERATIRLGVEPEQREAQR